MCAAVGLRILLVSTLCGMASLASADEAATTEPVLVTADPLGTQIEKLPTSATVVDKSAYENQPAALGDVLALIPGVNFAGGSNQPRFLQIRGIGELEQYEGAPAASVGLLVDDMDFTGLGSAVQTFDAEQVEVLRGPQGMAFGTNALAGLMHVRLADPTPITSGRGRVIFGSDDLAGGGLAVGGPIDGTNERVLFRVSAYHEQQNGFRENEFLHDDSTAKRDQFTGNAKVRIRATDATTVDLSLLRADMENGYDHFSIENRFKTYSDRPGIDEQGTTAGSVKVLSELSEDLALTSITSITKSDLTYSYDGDWGNNAYWEPYAPYDYFSETVRDRHLAYQELRLSSGDKKYEIGKNSRWLAGLYAQRLTEDSDIRNDADGIPYDTLVSDFSSLTSAIFGQYEQPLTSSSSATLGLRIEQKRADYEDSRGTDAEPDDTMLGGNFSLQHALSKNSMVYGLVSRGYKAGGVNTGIAVPDDRRSFEAEYLWNFETGVKGAIPSLKLTSNVALFHGLRRDQQVKLAVQNDPSDPLSFTYLTDNAARGRTTGLEWETAWRATERVNVTSALSLLTTRFTDLEAVDLTLEGREASHAPSWQYAVAPTYYLSDAWFTTVRVTGKDAFYFDDVHNERSNPYSIVDLFVGYEGDNWVWSVWAKNLFDRRYAVRGFFFGNEPPNFENELYKQLGDPFQVGTTLTLYF